MSSFIFGAREAVPDKRLVACDAKVGSVSSTSLHSVHGTGKKKGKAVKLSPPLVHAERKKFALLAKMSPELSGSSSASSSDSSMSVYSSLVDPMQIYTFRTYTIGTVTASVNTWAGYVNFDPTASGEWSSISSLFGEYRLSGIRMTLVPTTQNSSGGNSSAPSIIGAVDMGLVGTPPSAAGNVADNPNARYISMQVGMPHTNYQWVTTGMERYMSWQIMGSGQTPYAGAYGSFIFWGKSVGASDTFVYYLESFCQVRART
jgi:hypothetical protein